MSQNWKIEETGETLREYINKIFEIEEVDIEIKSNSPTEDINEAKKATTNNIV